MENGVVLGVTLDGSLAFLGITESNYHAKTVATMTKEGRRLYDATAELSGASSLSSSPSSYHPFFTQLIPRRKEQPSLKHCTHLSTRKGVIGTLERTRFTRLHHVVYRTRDGRLGIIVSHFFLCSTNSSVTPRPSVAPDPAQYPSLEDLHVLEVHSSPRFSRLSLSTAL